jgi:two-component system response regulator DevR
MPFSYDDAALHAENERMRMPEHRAIRLLLVDEERLVRAALQKLVESWPEYEVVGEVGSKEETLGMLDRLDPDVVLLSLPGEETQSVEIVSELVQVAGRAQLLVLVGEGVPGLAAEIVRMGARGVVRKNRAPDELRRAIQTVHEGREIWLDRASLAMLVTTGSRRLENPKSSLAQLTLREREVVNLVIKGLKNKEVGERLFISETTVRHHLTTIFTKLEVRNRFELIDQVHRHRFTPAEPAWLPHDAKEARGGRNEGTK